MNRRRMNVGQRKRFRLFFFVVVLFAEDRFSSANKDGDLYMATCRRDLGMSSGAISDSSLSASSSYDDKSVGPVNSRIRQEKNGGAWCPKLPISKEMYEWLQIDLGEVKVISLVETQGRFGNGQGQEYTPNYLLEYQRQNDSRWIRYKDRRGSEVIKGNSNTYIAELRELRPPILATSVRFIPWSNHPRMMCLRVELYGCQWTDGVMSYSMRQGDRRGPEIDLFDFTYDGLTRDGHLSEGLGQLTDWEEGNTNFRLDQTGNGRKGFEWVGWKNDTNASSAPLEILFYFDRLRNFTTIRLHANNFFSKDVSIFRKVSIYFSLDDGASFRENALVYEYMKDVLIEAARHVIVPIPHRIATVVKLVFFFELRWIMLSEVRFESEIVSGVPSDFLEFNSTSDLLYSSGNSTITIMHSHLHIDNNTSQSDSPKYGVVADDQQITKTFPAFKTVDERAGMPNSLVDAGVKHKQLFDDAYIGIIVGMATAFVLIVTGVVAIVAFRHRRNKYSRAILKSDLPVNRMNFKLPSASNASNGKFSKGNVYKSIATNEQGDCEMKETAINRNQCRGLSTFFVEGGDKMAADGKTYAYELPHISSGKSCFSDLSRRNCDIQEYERYSAMYDGSGESGAGMGKTCHSLLSSGFLACSSLASRSLTLVPPLPPRRLQAAKAARAFGGIGLASGSGLLASSNQIPLPEFPRQSLVFIEKLGEGHFGEVYLCEVVAAASPSAAAAAVIGDRASKNDDSLTSADNQMVVVKMLKPHSSDQNRLDFQAGMSTCFQLKDPNIIQFLGVCPQDSQPPAYVLEYLNHGNLQQFLISRVPENTLTGLKHQQSLSHGCLIFMATQVASGMKFLETLNIVHRDLAARNCLVGDNYVVKIIDISVNQFAYSSDYYRLGGAGGGREEDLVPIRWTAWEGVLQNTFTCKSDVWSFGVTLWEILGLARTRPYTTLTDEQVVVLCEQFCTEDGVDEYLTRPANCPKEIFDLMKECWNKNESQRPTFKEIHMFLQQKNAGFNPKEH